MLTYCMGPAHRYPGFQHATGAAAGLVAALRLSALALAASIAMQRLLRLTVPLGLVSGYAVLLQTGALVAFLFETGAKLSRGSRTAESAADHEDILT